MASTEQEAVLAESLARLEEGDRTVTVCVNGVVTFERKKPDPAPEYVTRIPRQRQGG